MKFLINLFILFYSSILSASDNWIEFGVTNNDGIQTTMYVDFEQVDKINNYLHSVTLFDFIPKISGEIGSLKFLKKYDCEEYKAKTLRIIYYNGQMGEGGVYGDDSNNEKWEYLMPASNEYELLKILCSNF